MARLTDLLARPLAGAIPLTLPDGPVGAQHWRRAERTWRFGALQRDDRLSSAMGETRR